MLPGHLLFYLFYLLIFVTRKISIILGDFFSLFGAYINHQNTIRKKYQSHRPLKADRATEKVERETQNHENQTLRVSVCESERRKIKQKTKKKINPQSKIQKTKTLSSVSHTSSLSVCLSLSKRRHEAHPI